MLEGIDVNQRIEFVSEFDKTEPKTVFVLKPLSGAEMLNFSGMFSGNSLIMKGSQIIDILSRSIVEIKNLDKEVPIVDYLNTLKIGPLNELMDKVGKINNLTEEESKN